MIFSQDCVDKEVYEHYVHLLDTVYFMFTHYSNIFVDLTSATKNQVLHERFESLVIKGHGYDE